MNLSRVWNLLRKDLALGPRSPFFLLALVLPLVITALIQLVFGELFSPTPRLGVVDGGDSAIVRAAAEYPGIRVQRVDRAEALWAMVEQGDVDIGWVVPAGFDEQLRAGQKPVLQVRVGGESLASHRILLAVAMADLVRTAAGSPVSLNVELVTIGEGSSLPLETRLLPIMVLITVMLSGIFLTAFSLVDEKVKGTFTAMLVTPMQISEILLGKGLFGFFVAITCGLMTLALNGVIGNAPLALLVVVCLAAFMMSEVGLILGSLVENTNLLFTVWKGGAWLLMLPVVPYLWDDFPMWLARMAPTYYFVDPSWRIAIEGATLADVGQELLIGAAICAGFIPLVLWAGRRAERAA